MAEHQFQKRLHDALHRGHRKATEEEVAEVTAVVLTIVAELTGELALVIAELADRVEALEARA
ncbi:MAG TPA: hypothetical protein VN971_06505 [Thermoanaerobaculia bacterium]|jgi:NTP pyrophosphatase (non-canonical NTP hydrolase)|nr:hypothetical protein [Thermoanaerobaculia bacterium]